VCRYHSHKLRSKALFVVFQEEIVKQSRNLCIDHAHTSHFRTSDVLTAKIMAAKKGVCAAPLRLNNWRIMQQGALKRYYNALLA